MDHHCPLGDMTNAIDLGSGRGRKGHLAGLFGSRRHSCWSGAWYISFLFISDYLVWFLPTHHFSFKLAVHEENENVDPAELKRQNNQATTTLRIPLSPLEDITLPIRPSFAMTINKAQGQTIPNVGIYLPEPVFSHGQIYVALSRGVSQKTTRVLAKPNNDVDSTGTRKHCL
ncbi:hypothetical protein SETIT_3G105700v2 [Setaria italica]|uniref:ATP-dependent DNA helicase n=1 Tax=Setaria italica TaxID=4555 RepID=K3ZEA7_SETIT|nr:hypothetical protein SETIT_3G105700v2 [Setaria italica]